MDMGNLNNILLEILATGVRFYAIKCFIDIFLSKDEYQCKYTWVLYVIACLWTSIIYEIFKMPVLNIISNFHINTDKYISRIRFNDRDNLTASLTSEKGVKCIFDAKTFMCVRNSLDLVESIVAIVVTFTKKRGLLSVKYDASDRRYLNIHVLNNRYYTADDFNKIWELYKKYESGENAIADSVYNENNIAAM